MKFSDDSKFFLNVKYDTSYVLTYDGPSDGSRQPVCAGKKSGHPGELWHFDDGYIINANTKTCITVDHDQTSLLLLPPAGAADQKWKMVDGHIVSKAHGTVLDVDGKTGPKVILHPKGGHEWQKFHITVE